MVAELEAAGVLRDPAVRAALLAVRREVLLPRAYVRRNPRGTDPGVWQLLDGADRRDRDEWLETIHSGASVLVQHDGEDLLEQQRRTVTGGSITGLSSTTAMTASVLQQLDLEQGARCLELGAGTGIAAALLAHLAGRRGSVTSVEADRHMAVAASLRLADAGVEVEVVAGDGLAGHSPGAPFDRIVSTFAVPRLPSAWLGQLADDGLLWTSLATSSPSWPGTVVVRRRRGRVAAELTGAPSGHRPLAGFEWLNLRGYRELLERAPGRTVGIMPALPAQEDRGFWVAVAHLVPGVVQNFDAPHLTLVAPRDGSWMTARPDSAGRVNVDAGGPRDLWAELDQVRVEWVGAGRPAAFQLEVGGRGEQIVHARHGRLSWTLPDHLPHLGEGGSALGAAPALRGDHRARRLEPGVARLHGGASAHGGQPPVGDGTGTTT